MRILIVSNLYPPIIYGGYETLCHQVVGALRERGHEVLVVTSDFMEETVEPDSRVVRSMKLTTNFPRQGEEVSFVDFRLSSIERIARHNLSVLTEELQRQRPDVVFCWCLNRASVAAIIAAQSLEIPVCWTINDEHPRQFVGPRGSGIVGALKSAVARRRWPHSTYGATRPIPMAVISNALLESLRRHGVPTSLARVVPQGVPIERFPYAPLPRNTDEPLRVLYAGQISQAKGVHTLIAAIGQLFERGVEVRLSVAGSGVPEYRARLDAAVLEKNLDGVVQFLGMVPHAELASLHQRHHVLVFSSEWEEPAGLSHMEAMASGMAVISTTTGGSAELIRHEVNALAYEKGDVDALARSLGRLHDDEPLRRRLAEQGHHYVKEHHSLRSYCARLEQFLCEVAVLPDLPSSGSPRNDAPFPALSTR